MPRPIPKPPRAEEVLAAVAARPPTGLGLLRHPDPCRAAADGAVTMPDDIASLGFAV